jgi:hypothetical protein
MKVGDLCVSKWDKELYIYLGEGYWKDWFRVLRVKTGETSQNQKDNFQPVKKCP